VDEPHFVLMLQTFSIEETKIERYFEISRFDDSVTSTLLACSENKRSIYISEIVEDLIDL